MANFNVVAFDEDLLKQAKQSWDFQEIGDLNFPHSGLMANIEKSLTTSGPSCNQMSFYAIVDTEQNLVVAISEMVMAKLGNNVLKVKQLDTHLCPSLREKVIIDEQEDAIDYASKVYQESIVHAFELNEEIRPRVLKLYAREKIHLEFFKLFEAAVAKRLELKPLNITIKGRWLEVRGHIGDHENENE